MTPSKAERAEATRAALVRAARELFADRGFADTATNEIVDRAGVTRGALYHHFADKEELFRAVYEDVETGVTARVVEALGAIEDPFEALGVGCDVFLDTCLERDVQRIVLLEGPSVLGWARWREIDQNYGLGLVQAGLAAAMEAGAIRDQPLEPLAHLMMGAIVEAGLVIAHSDDPKAARKQMGEAVRSVLDGLRAVPRQRRRTGR